MVLWESRKIEALCFEGARLINLPDFSIETQKQRKSFDHVKLALRQKGLNIAYSSPPDYECRMERPITSLRPLKRLLIGWSPYRSAEIVDDKMPFLPFFLPPMGEFIYF